MYFRGYVNGLSSTLFFKICYFETSNNPTGPTGSQPFKLIGFSVLVQYM